MRALMAMGESYYLNKKQQYAELWFHRAADVGKQFTESKNPNLLHYSSRTQIRYACYLMSQERFEKAIKKLMKSLDSLAFEINLRFNPAICNESHKEDKKRASKVTYKKERVLRFTSIAYVLLSHCFEKIDCFDKTLECDWFANSLLTLAENPSDSMLLSFQKLHIENKQRYSSLVEEGTELQRVITFLHRKYETYALGEDYTFQEEQKLVFIKNCRERMYKNLVDSKALENRPDWVLRGNDEVMEQADQAGHKNESMPGKKFEPKQSRSLEGLKKGGHEKQDLSLGHKRTKLKWVDEKNNLRYSDPITEKFSPDVFMQFEDYQKFKVEQKKQLDVEQLKEDRFWYIRDRKINKYDPEKKERDAEKRKQREKEARERAELKYYVFEESVKLTNKARATKTAYSFEASKVEDSQEQTQEPQDGFFSEPPSVLPRPDPPVESYGLQVVFGHSNLVEKFWLTNPVVAKKPQKEKSSGRKVKHPMIPETKAMDNFFRAQINTISDHNRQSSVRAKPFLISRSRSRSPNHTASPKSPGKQSRPSPRIKRAVDSPPKSEQLKPLDFSKLIPHELKLQEGGGLPSTEQQAPVVNTTDVNHERATTRKQDPETQGQTLPSKQPRQQPTELSHPIVPKGLLSRDSSFEDLKREALFLKLQDEKDQLELRQAVNKLKVNSVNIGGSFFKYRLPEEISVAKESVNIQLLTEFVEICQKVDRERRRLEEGRSAQKASVKLDQKVKKRQQPAIFELGSKKSIRSVSLEPSSKHQRFEELDKINKEKEDLFKRMSRYPDVFPLNNISYTRRKNMRKKVLQELNPRYLEQPDIPKEPDMNIIFKNVREWIQRSMDVLEKDIMFDKNKKQASGKPTEQETSDFQTDQYSQFIRPLFDAHCGLLDSLKGKSGLGNLKKRRGYLSKI